MMKYTTKIIFKNKSDFRNRIAKLWQNQKDDEVYDFEFPDKETENEFEKLMAKFSGKIG